MLKKLETELRIRGLSIHTIKSYILQNRLFLEFIKKQPLEIEEDDIKEYFANLQKNNISNKTLALKKAALSFLYKLEGKKYNLDLRAIKSLLKKLGNPEKKTHPS